MTVTWSANDVAMTTLADARESLEMACDALDEAVSAIPDDQHHRALANAGIVGLLLRVVTARRQVRKLALTVADGTTSRAWASPRR